MRFRVTSLLAICLAFTAALRGPAAPEAAKSGPLPGTELPGPFQAWSVVHPLKEREGRYHAPACEQGLNPTVLVFVPGLNDPQKPQPLSALIKRIDGTIEANPDADLGAYVVVLNDGGYRQAVVAKTDELAKATEAREAEEAKARQLVKTAGARHVALSLDTSAGPAGYKLDPKAVTVLLITQQRVAAAFTFGADKPLNDKAVEAVLADVSKLLPAKKERPRRRTAPAPTKPTPSDGTDAG